MCLKLQFEYLKFLIKLVDRNEKMIQYSLKIFKKIFHYLTLTFDFSFSIKKKKKTKNLVFGTQANIFCFFLLMYVVSRSVTSEFFYLVRLTFWLQIDNKLCAIWHHLSGLSFVLCSSTFFNSWSSCKQKHVYCL